MDIKITPLAPDLLNDYLYFFDNIMFSENPGWSACYCYSYHFTGQGEEWVKEKNREAVIKLIKEQKLKGYMAFYEQKPVGWCNVNNRLNYERLLKYYDFVDLNEKKICSIVCFLIHPDYRRKGIAQKIINAIITDYTAQNYNYIEAYPGKGNLSSEAHYKGPLSLYEKNGFKQVKEYKDYIIVRKPLK